MPLPEPFCSLSPASPVGPTYAIVFGSFLARRCWELQAINMRKHFGRTGPATEIEAEQLIGAFGRGPAHPQTDEQAGNQRHVDLQLHPILTLTEQMATAQDTFEPAEEEFHRPAIPVGQRNQVGRPGPGDW